MKLDDFLAAQGWLAAAEARQGGDEEGGVWEVEGAFLCPAIPHGWASPRQQKRSSSSSSSSSPPPRSKRARTAADQGESLAAALAELVEESGEEEEEEGEKKNKKKRKDKEAQEDEEEDQKEKTKPAPLPRPLEFEGDGARHALTVDASDGRAATLSWSGGRTFVADLGQATGVYWPGAGASALVVFPRVSLELRARSDAEAAACAARLAGIAESQSDAALGDSDDAGQPSDFAGAVRALHARGEAWAEHLNALAQSDVLDRASVEPLSRARIGPRERRLLAGVLERCRLDAARDLDAAFDAVWPEGGAAPSALPPEAAAARLADAARIDDLQRRVVAVMEAQLVLDSLPH